mmetsp:Transcript_69841/g.164311  ORF Transcript_69841/g.164311 Transcript_69841/m.164311 type:complete len:452 (-) Transcript_69841:160-1515(-)
MGSCHPPLPAPSRGRPCLCHHRRLPLHRRRVPGPRGRLLRRRARRLPHRHHPLRRRRQRHRHRPRQHHRRVQHGHRRVRQRRDGGLHHLGPPGRVEPRPRRVPAAPRRHHHRHAASGHGLGHPRHSQRTQRPRRPPPPLRRGQHRARHPRMVRRCPRRHRRRVRSTGWAVRMEPSWLHRPALVRQRLPAARQRCHVLSLRRRRRLARAFHHPPTCSSPGTPRQHPRLVVGRRPLCCPCRPRSSLGAADVVATPLVSPPVPRDPRIPLLLAPTPSLSPSSARRSLSRPLRRAPRCPSHRHGPRRLRMDLPRRPLRLHPTPPWALALAPRFSPGPPAHLRHGFDSPPPPPLARDHRRASSPPRLPSRPHCLPRPRHSAQPLPPGGPRHDQTVLPAPVSRYAAPCRALGSRHCGCNSAGCVSLQLGSRRCHWTSAVCAVDRPLDHHGTPRRRRL